MNTVTQELLLQFCFIAISFVNNEQQEKDSVVATNLHVFLGTTELPAALLPFDFPCFQ